VKQADAHAEGAEEEEIAAPPPPPPAAPRPRTAGPARPGGRPARGGGDMTRLFVAGGRALHITPGDLVGAIANEAGVSGRAIGAIHIDARHAVVEVARDVANDVIEALRNAKIKGKRLAVRRDRMD